METVLREELQMTAAEVAEAMAAHPYYTYYMKVRHWNGRINR